MDILFTAHSLILVIARVNTSSEEEEEMALNPRRDLKDLVAGRNKGSSSKKASQIQLPPNLPLPPSSLSSQLTPKSQLAKEEEKREGH